MRKYTEPVAEYHGLIAPGGVKISYQIPGHPDQMPVNHWVECKGFEHLRILAVGDGGFKVLVIVYAEANPAPGVLPAVFTELSIDSVSEFGYDLNTNVVAQTLDLVGMRGLGIELQNDPLNGNATEISLLAFLR